MANGANPFMLGQLALMLQQPGGIDNAATRLASAGARVPPVPQGGAAIASPVSPVSPVPPVASTALPNALPANAGPGGAGGGGGGIAQALSSIQTPAPPQILPVPPAPSPVNPGGATGPAAIPGLNELIIQLLFGGGANAAGGLGSAGAPGGLNLGQLIQGA